MDSELQKRYEETYQLLCQSVTENELLVKKVEVGVVLLKFQDLHQLHQIVGYCLLEGMANQQKCIDCEYNVRYHVPHSLTA